MRLRLEKKMLAIQINNPNLENQFLEYAKQQQKSIEELVNEAINFFIKYKKDENIKYNKKNPMENLHKIKYKSFDDDLDDVKLFQDIEDSAEFIHKLRRNR